MNKVQDKVRRIEEEVRVRAEEFARELTRTLVLLHFHGTCKCGLMLTERDRGAKRENYTCPRCGASGSLKSLAAATAAAAATA